MMDELIGQIYASLNIALYVHFTYRLKFYPSRNRPRDYPPFDEFQLRQNIEEIVWNFFKVDCEIWAQNTNLFPEQEDASNGSYQLRNKNQWSGKWGFKMFYDLNFVKVNTEVRDLLYPHVGPVEYFNYHLPPSITSKDQEARDLAIAEIGYSQRMKSVDDARLRPWQTMMQGMPELMQKISNYTLYQRPRPMPATWLNPDTPLAASGDSSGEWGQSPPITP